MSSASSPNPQSGSTATRASLLSRARGRESAAWCELVELYGPLIARWCQRYGLDGHATADIVQDVFASVARKLDSYEPVRASGAFRGWLWTITANKLRDRARSHRKHPVARGGSTAIQSLQQVVDLQANDEQALAEEPTTDREQQELIARGLAQVRAEFEPRTWEIFQRLVIDQVPTANVAAEFNLKPASVRQIRSRILRRLRQQLGDLEV